MSHRVIKEFQRNKSTVSLEATTINNVPCIIALIDFGMAKAVRSLKKQYRAISLESAQVKVNSATDNDITKLLASLEEELAFTTSLEKEFSTPLPANYEHQQKIKKLKESKR